MKKIIRYLIALFIFISLGINIDAIKASAITEEKDINKLTLRESSNIGQAVSNIYSGKATVNDYLALGLNSVTSDNLAWINAEVHDRVNFRISESKVDQRKESIITAVNLAIKDYPVVKAINDGKEHIDEDSDYPKVEEYYNLAEIIIGAEDLPETRKAVTIGKRLKGRELTKQELIDLLKRYSSNPDSYFIIQPIKNAIDKADSGESPLSKEEVQKIIDETIEKINESYSRIVKGEGILDDYSLVQIEGVTKENIEWVNAEIKENVDIKLALEDGDGKIYKVQREIRTLLYKVYPVVKAINDGKEHIEDRNYPKVEEYYDIAEIEIMPEDLSETRKAVIIGKRLKGRELTKQELINLLKRYSSNPDSYYIVQSIKNAIDKANSGESPLSKEEVQKIIDETIEKINESYERIVKGEGSLDDYSFVQIEGVTKENIEWVNAEIKENVDIKLVLEDGNGKIKRVQNEIRILLYKVYPNVKAINDGKEHIDENSYDSRIKEYYNLAEIIISEVDLPETRKAIAAAKLEKGRELTKTEIIEILKNF